MTQSTPDSSAKPTPIRARLDKFQTVDEFAAGYQQHFLPDGIRLPTRQVKPVGTRIALKLELATGATVLRADGVVESIRENQAGQAVAMDIRFEKLEPASRALVERIQAERNWERGRSGPVATVAIEEVRTTEGTADFEAIADELDSTFDSIFAAGPFADAAAAEGSHDTSILPEHKTLLQRPGTLDAALAAAEPQSGTPEWASSLGSDFAPAAPPEASLTGSPAPEENADALLAAFGMNRDATAEATPQPSTTEETTESGSLPIGRIAFQKVPRAEFARAGEDDPGRLRSEASTRRPAKPSDPNDATSRAHASAWAESSDEDDASPSPARTADDDVRSLLKQITSDHAAVVDSAPAPLEIPIAPSKSPPPPLEDDDDDLEALLGVSNAPSSQAAPPLPVLPTKLSADSSAAADEDDAFPLPASSPAADASDTSSTAETDSSAPTTAIQSAAPRGFIARFFAWLRGLFGGK